MPPELANLDTRAILESFFTLPGAVVAAGLVATIIQYVLKPLPAIGKWVEDGHEYLVSLGIAATLLIVAIVALEKPIDLLSIVGYFLAWLGLAKLIGAAFDVGVTVKASVTTTSK